MKNLIFLLCFILSASSYGQLKESQKQDITSEINLLENGGFENGLAGWIKSGSSTLTKDLASPLVGKASAVWNPSAASETLSSPLLAVKDGMKGRNICSVQGIYLWDSGVQDDIEIQAYDGSSVIASYKPSPTNGQATPFSFPFFTCPSSGSMQIRMVSAADAAEIELDNLYLGAGRNNIFAVPKNQIETKILSANSTTNGEMSDLTFNNLEIGATYEVFGAPVLSVNDGVVDTSVEFNAIHNGAIIGRASFRANNGTSSRDFVQGSINFTFTATTSTLTFESNSASVNSYISGDGTREQTYVQLEKRNDLGSNFQEGLTVETTGWYVKSIIAGADPSLSLSAVVSPTEITNGSLSLANYGTTPAKIGCSGTNPATGLTCAAGSEGYAISFQSPVDTQALVCANISHGFRISSNSNLAALFRLVKTNNASQTIIDGNRANVWSSGDTDGSVNQFDQTNPIRICEIMNVNSGENTFRVFYTQSVSGTASLNLVTAPMSFEVVPINQNFPTPVFTDLQNSLNSKLKMADGTTGQKYMSLRGVCSPTSSITNSIGFDSIGNIVAGQCTLTHNQNVNNYRHCSVNAENPDPQAIYGYSVTANTVVVGCNLRGTGSDCTSYGFSLNCVFD